MENNEQPKKAKYTPEQKAKWNKKAYEKNKEARLAKIREYQEENKDKINLYSKLYRQRKRDELQAMKDKLQTLAVLINEDF